MVAAQVVLTPVMPASSNSTATSSTCKEWSDRPFNDVICLFDVDGTLSLSRKVSDVLIYQYLSIYINIYQYISIYICQLIN